MPRLVPYRASLAAQVAVLALALTSLPTNASADSSDFEPSGYELRLLTPAEGYVAAAANGINDNGVVVGLTRPSDKAQPQEAAIWQAGQGEAQPLPQLAGSTFARAFDISSSGVIAGEAFDEGSVSIPVKWQDGVVALPSPSSTGSGVAWDVADNGQILATGRRGLAVVAYLTNGDGFTLLPDPSNETGKAKEWRATTISDDGNVVAGVSTIAVPHDDHFHDEKFLTLWHDDHSHLYAQAPHGSYFEVKGVNNQGVIVGAVAQNDLTHAARWVRGEQQQLTDPQIADYANTTATAVNNAGTVVGYASKMAGHSGFGGSAVAWFGDTVVDLNTKVDLPEGVHLQSASDINSSGQIVGTAATPNGQAGYLLTPISGKEDPQPTASPSPSDAVPAPDPSAPAPDPSAPGPSTEPTTQPEPSTTPPARAQPTQSAAPTALPSSSASFPGHSDPTPDPSGPTRPRLPKTGS